jgi:para-aminobenzoate synthetase component 1
MWSDRLSAAKRRRLTARLHAVLPAPDPHGRGAVTPLRLQGARGTATVEQMAEELRDEPGFAWLDGGPAGSHRFFIRPLATLSVRSGRATVIGPIRPIRPIGRMTFSAGGFDLLEAAFAAWGGPSRALLAGWLGYELAAELESLEPASPADLEDDLKLPDLHLSLYDEVLCHDGNGWHLESTDAWRTGIDGDRVRDAEARLAAARKREVPEPPGGRLADGPVTGRPNSRGFLAAVERTVSRIRRGQIYQTNLCRRLEAKLPAGRIWPLWQRLRAASPAAHGAYLSLSGRAGRDGAVLSVSPELFLSVRDGIVTTQPIKGTRPRGATPREDRALARELAESAKDRAELAMIVDVARNDLGRVCTTGSVEVVRHAELLTLPTLHHTVSTIRGRLRSGSDPVALLRAAFPPASITGAPKIQAIVVAAGEEERRRGPAMGAIGWLSLGGDLELSVAIRTAAAAGGKIVYHAGCGITADSDPEQELEESAVKARAFLTALGAAENP